MLLLPLIQLQVLGLSVIFQIRILNQTVDLSNYLPMSADFMGREIIVRDKQGDYLNFIFK